MPYKRTDRVNALLQRELGTLISEELTDPRIAFATVTAVETTSDLRTARVHVSVLGSEEEPVDVVFRALRAVPVYGGVGRRGWGMRQPVVAFVLVVGWSLGIGASGPPPSAARESGPRVVQFSPEGRKRSG